MGRPPTSVGTSGSVSFDRNSGGNYLARTRYREYDGTLRRISATGKTKAAALAALKVRLRDRRTPLGEDMDGTTKLSALAEVWLTDKLGSDALSSQTKSAYEYTLNKYVLPPLGNLRLQEVSTSTVDRYLKDLTKNTGHGAAKSARAVLSGVFDLAVRLDVLLANPVRSAARIRSPRRHSRPTLTDALLGQLRLTLGASKYAQEMDLPDLIDFLASTGVRIGEAIALRASRLDLISPIPTARIDSTVIRQPGKPALIQEFPKSESGTRSVPLSPYIADVLRQRIASGKAKPLDGDVLLFPSPLGRLRDVSNTTSSFRNALREDGSKFDGITFHSFRRYVLTQLDAHGFSARQVSDLAGHSDVSMTQNVYLDRGAIHGEMAHALDLAAVNFVRPSST